MAHLFFDMIGLHNTPGRLGAGIDTRGVGGYVVVPPSRLVNRDTGEVTHYTTSQSNALSMRSTPPLPDWLVEMLDDDDSVLSHQDRYVSPLPDFADSEADKARQGWVWEIELDRDGWSRVRGRGQDETGPVRARTLRGPLAVLHGDDGPLVVRSPPSPPGGRDTRDGWLVVLAVDYIVAYRRGRHPVGGSPLCAGSPPRRSRKGEPPAADEGTALNLPTDSGRSVHSLSHIHQAGAVGGLLTWMRCWCTRWRTATLIHPCFKLPGAEQGLIRKASDLRLPGASSPRRRGQDDGGGVGKC
jgi:hypothetical protein